MYVFKKLNLWIVLTRLEIAAYINNCFEIIIYWQKFLFFYLDDIVLFYPNIKFEKTNC